MNTKPYEMLKDQILATIEKTNNSREVFEAVLKHLEKFENKKITQRIVTLLRKVMPENVFYLEKTILGSYELRIWGDKIGYDNKLYVRLSRSQSEHVYTKKFTLEYNTPRYLSTERVNHLEQSLGKLQEWVATRDYIQSCEDNLKKEMEEFDSKYLFS